MMVVQDGDAGNDRDNNNCWLDNFQNWFRGDLCPLM